MKKYNKIIIIIACILTILASICFMPISASKLIPVIEKQVEQDLGVKIHIDKLILRVGPFLKIKTPIMHIMYQDGQKFAQFDNVKFYISWFSLFKDTPTIDKIKANRLTVRVNSDDIYLEKFIEQLKNKSNKNNPNIALREYLLTYNNKLKNDKYILEGQELELNKLTNFKNYKLKTKGSFIVDKQQYITYDLTLLPKFDFPEVDTIVDITSFIEQLKELDFHSDLIADLKLYKNNDVFQASGFVNIDNISVLDPLRKNPKSFIYLTLWGDKASILSNIYTSQTQKIYVEGMINNSQKPVFDIKVKTDEIELENLYKKLKILTCFSELKNIDSINGLLTANFTLKGDINKLKSNGYLKIVDAKVLAKGVQIEKINSDIDFSNNSINIKNAIGYVKNSPILLKGNIDKSIDLELLMNKVELKHLCPSFCGVEKGLGTVVAKISGTLGNIIHKENIAIDNLKLRRDDISIDIDSFRLDTNKNNKAYVSNVICTTPYSEFIKIPSMHFEVGADYIKLPETNIYMPNSNFVIKGDLTDLYKKSIAYNVNFKGILSSRDVNQIKHSSLRYPLRLNINGNKLVQNISSQILLEDSSILEEPTVLNLLAKIDKKSVKLEDLSLTSFEGKDFNTCKVTPKTPKKVVITGLVENLTKPVMKNVRVFLPQQLNLHLFDTVAHIKGDLFLNGDFFAPEIIGQLLVQNLINQDLQLSITNGSFDFNKNTAMINMPMIKVADTSVNLSGNLSTDFSRGLSLSNLNIKSKYINTDTLLMYKDSPFVKNLKLNIKNSKLYAERLLLSLYNEPLYLSAFSCDFSIIDNDVKLKNITSELYNGKIAGNINYNLRDEHYSSNLMGRGLSASSIFELISSRKDSVSGVMDFDSAIQGELVSKQSVNGNIKFIINNGRMSSLGKLEHLLYAQNVIADNMLRTSLSVVTKAISLKDTGLFKYLRGDINLENGVANINLLQSQGPLMSLFIKGKYNPINDYAQLQVLGRLSDEIISGLGAFGDFSLNKLMIMLTGEDNKYNIIPEDFDKIPQLPMKNTKEFRSIINGIIDKPSSVLLFNWISYSQKSLKQKEIPNTNVSVPKFVEELPY